MVDDEETGLSSPACGLLGGACFTVPTPSKQGLLSGEGVTGTSVFLTLWREDI